MTLEHARTTSRDAARDGRAAVESMTADVPLTGKVRIGMMALPGYATIASMSANDVVND